MRELLTNKITKMLGVVVALSLFGGCASMGEGSNADKRQNILQMKEQVLTELFEQKPDTRAQLNSAPGYAVFSNANINLIFIAAGTGYGVVKDMKTK